MLGASRSLWLEYPLSSPDSWYADITLRIGRFSKKKRLRDTSYHRYSLFTACFQHGCVSAALTSLHRGPQSILNTFLYNCKIPSRERQRGFRFLSSSESTDEIDFRIVAEKMGSQNPLLHDRKIIRDRAERYYGLLHKFGLAWIRHFPSVDIIYLIVRRVNCSPILLLRF